MKFRDDETILICAFRYALGRKSYMPSHIMDDIDTNINELEKPEIFIREIEEYLKTDYAKDDWNVDSWRCLLSNLKEIV